jgi:hypothetical protein
MRHSCFFNAVLISVLCLSGCASKTVVRKIEPGKGVNGIVYALPKTVVTATITVQRVNDTTGPYRSYTPCFFPDLTPEDLVNSVTFIESKSFKITNGNITTRGVPDETQVFVIDSGAGVLHKKVLNAQLTEDGVLTTSDVENKNESVTFTISALKTLATIAGDVLSVSAPAALRATFQKTPQTIPTEPLQECSAALDHTIVFLHTHEVGDEQTRQQAIRDLNNAYNELDKLEKVLSRPCPASAPDSAPIDGPALLPNSKPAKPLSKPKAANNATSANLSADTAELAQRCNDQKQVYFDNSTYNHAAVAFATLAKLEQSRRDTLASWPQGDLSSDTLKEVLTEYQDAEGKYVAYFLGNETTNVWAPVVEFTPPKADLSEASCGSDAATNLFSYVPDQGACANDSASDDLSLPDIPAKFKAKSCKSDSPKVQLSLSCKPKSQLALDVRQAQTGKDGRQASGGDRSYYYRVPARVTAAIFDTTDDKNKKTFGKTNVGIAQWGVVASLPASAGGSRNKYSVTLAPATGALTNFAMDSDATLESADLSGLETGTKAITDQLAARRKKPTKADQLGQQEKTLETQCKINAITKVNDPTLDCSSVFKSQ